MADSIKGGKREAGKAASAGKTKSAKQNRKPTGKVQGGRRAAKGNRKPARSEPPPSLTALMLAHAEQLAAECSASILVYADAIQGFDWTPAKAVRDRVIFVTRGEEEEAAVGEREKLVVRVPSVVLTRMGQIKVGVFMALSHSLLKSGDQVVCLAGSSGEGDLDMIRVLEVDQGFQFFGGGSDDAEQPPDVRPEVLSRVVEIAIDLGSEGREGKPVGTLFVLGDEDTVVPLTRPLILNPFHGYPEDERNVLSDSLEETIKELATVDGAFVIGADGTVLSAGTYLKTSALPEDSLPRGMGARHQAAAGITFATNCMAVAVSESTGSVSVFRGGQVVTEIEKPQKARQQKSTKG